MGKHLIATGQATVIAQKDSYTINQSVGEYIFTAQSNGTIPAAVSFSSILKVTLGDLNITDFTIGAITKPSGFSAITVNNTNKSVTYSITAGTTTLADSGLIAIPVIIGGVSYQVSFSWSKAKAGATGPAGSPGADANMLDWVQDWNSNKTIIGSNSVITPKIFAGTKNANGTITGTAIGRFSLSTLNASGSVTTEVIDGVYGFKDGNRTFALDNTGNVKLGRGNQYIKYNAVTGRVEFGSDVSLAWIGATFIDRNGIFTGTLSAGTVNALQLNASQIVAGTINAARIDVASLKASLITAGNIEALTLNVIRGKIGGWSIDTDSIYRGTKNNASGAYTAASGAVCIGSNGIRGFKWRLDATGAGAVAGGNISWDAAGNVTFGASVVLNWTTPINNITTALGGTSFPKLTKISSTGIYTGTLTAAQVNAVAINAGSITAGTLSADRIAAGSLNGNKITARTITADRIVAGSITAGEINVSSVQASVVTAGAVNALTCSFVRGTIGGWTINSTQIYKNSVYLTADGSIVNSTKWKLNNDGSGQIANGAITWNAAGTVTFSSTVSLNWTNAATNALNSAKSYADTKKSEAISAASTDATNKANAAKELASAMAFGRMLNRDPTFWNGNNGINVYNNSNNGTVTITRTTDSNAPNDSKYVLLIKNTGVASPNCGGFFFGTNTSYRKIFITRIIAKIPTGRNISYHSNAIGSGGSQKWLTPVAGTGDWREYICKVTCGTATFSSTHFFAIDGSAGTASAPVQWWLAYATVFDVTSTEKYTTTIDANGIYTSTLNANQITAGTISADRIAAGSLNGNKITARSITADRIVASSITASEIAARTITASQIKASAITAYEIAGSTITAAEIASRTITASKIASSTITAYEIAARTITAAEIKASAITAYEIAGSTITAAEIAARTITAAKIASNTITANEINVGSIQASVVTAGAVNGLTCTFNKGQIGGFTISGTAIYSINVTPGHNVGIQSNGYIYNCNSSNTAIDYWALNTDGSAIFGTGKIKFGASGDGWLANKNISWDASGNVTMTGTITATAGKIGNFNISGGKLVNSTTTASIEFTGLSGSSLYLNTTSSLISIRSDVNKTGISIQTYSSGARGIYIVANAGSTYSIEAYGPMQLGQRTGERWCVPGVLYVGCKYSAGYNNYYRKVWGDGMTVSSFSHIGDGKYRVYHNLAHTDYTVMAILWSSTGYYGYFRLLERTSSYFVIQNIGSSGKPDQAPFDFVVMGRKRW